MARVLEVHSWGRRALLASTVAVAASCGSSGPTALVAVVGSDFVPRAELQYVEAEARWDDGQLLGRRRFDLTTKTLPAEGEVAFVPRNPEDSRRVTLTVTGTIRSETGETYALQQQFTTRFNPATVRYVRFFLTRSCRGRDCASGQTCVPGAAGEAQCVGRDAPILTDSSGRRGIGAMPWTGGASTTMDAGADSQGDLGGEGGGADAVDENRADVNGDGLGATRPDGSDEDSMPPDMPSDLVASDGPADAADASLDSEGDVPPDDDASIDGPVPDGRSSDAELPDGSPSADRAPDGEESTADIACPSGTSRCGSVCVSTATSTEHCGACGVVCPAPTGGRARCALGRCGFECLVGYDLVGATCVARMLPPPRALYPWSGATLTTQRPTLRWELPPSTLVDGALVEVCRDSACSAVVDREEVDAPASSWRPTRPLPANSTLFWRLTARVAGTIFPSRSAPWTFTVPGRDSAHDSAWGSRFDVNGDGFSDALVRRGDTDVRMVLGGPSGPWVFDTAFWPIESATMTLSRAGDLDGDGASDFVMSRCNGSVRTCSGSVDLFYGGTRLAPGAAIPIRIGGGFAAFGALGDLNGDGWGEFIAAAPDRGLYLYQRRTDGSFGYNFVLDYSDRDQVVGALNVDGDRLADFAIVREDGARNLRVYRADPASPAGVALTLYPIAVASAGNPGDANGDGIGDIALVTNLGRVQLHCGRAGAPPDMTPCWGADLPGGGFGSTTRLRSAGDVDGDGFADLLIVLREAQRVLFYRGAATGYEAPVELRGPPTTDPAFGYDATSGDFDGDGRSDVMISSPPVPPRDAGNLYFYRWEGGALRPFPASPLTSSGTLFGRDFG
ncbi:MAG: FG-GAP-like repeat-containing protein [Polyangiales bacterium]